MAKDYSYLGPAYRNFKVRDDVYVPEPVDEFSGDNPFTRMAPIRGQLKDVDIIPDLEVPVCRSEI